MRSPDILGVLAAAVVGVLLMVLLLVGVLAQPASPPTPGAPTQPPLATDTPVPPSATPRATPSPTPTPLVPPGESPPTVAPSGVGQPAPRIRLPQLGGGEIDSADYAGQPLWINFMATWCPQCVDELPMMERMQADLGDRLTILVVDVGEDRQTVEAFINALGVELPVGLDTDSTTQAEWGAFALPVHFWVGTDGYVTSVLFGGAPPEVFAESIRTVVPEFSVEEEE